MIHVCLIVSSRYTLYSTPDTHYVLQNIDYLINVRDLDMIIRSVKWEPIYSHLHLPTHA